MSLESLAKGDSSTTELKPIWEDEFRSVDEAEEFYREQIDHLADKVMYFRHVRSAWQASREECRQTKNHFGFRDSLKDRLLDFGKSGNHGDLADLIDRFIRRAIPQVLRSDQGPFYLINDLQMLYGSMVLDDIEDRPDEEHPIYEAVTHELFNVLRTVEAMPGVESDDPMPEYASVQKTARRRLGMVFGLGGLVAADMLTFIGMSMFYSPDDTINPELLPVKLGANVLGFIAGWKLSRKKADGVTDRVYRMVMKKAYLQTFDRQRKDYSSRLAALEVPR